MTTEQIRNLGLHLLKKLEVPQVQGKPNGPRKGLQEGLKHYFNLDARPVTLEQWVSGKRNPDRQSQKLLEILAERSGFKKNRAP